MRGPSRLPLSHEIRIGGIDRDPWAATSHDDASPLAERRGAGHPAKVHRHFVVPDRGVVLKVGFRVGLEFGQGAHAAGSAKK